MARALFAQLPRLPCSECASRVLTDGAISARVNSGDSVGGRARRCTRCRRLLVHLRTTPAAEGTFTLTISATALVKPHEAPRAIQQSERSRSTSCAAPCDSKTASRFSTPSEKLVALAGGALAVRHCVAGRERRPRSGRGGGVARDHFLHNKSKCSDVARSI